MLTREIYRQYFLEIHHKQREMIIMLRQGIDKISDDRMQKSLAWHMKREIRLAVMIQKLVRILSAEPETDQEQVLHPNQLNKDKISYISPA